ncbi:hypothetical protein MAR_004001 [Mya arenaria]|uniref:Uncharacterized protein n=1 Tax=Mya arenaria TaxID=6604 RepID=A0ABY7EZ19_MYAAR|nr:hypothetical protein MAR_004001 [Mya arenaria]
MVWSKHVANYIKVQVVYSHAKTCLEIGQSFSEKKLQYLRKKWNYYAFYGDPAFILGIDNDEKKDGLRCLLQCLRCQKELARHCILTTDDQQPTSLFNEQCFRLLREWISSAPSGHLNLLSKMYDNIVAEFNRIDHGDSTDHEHIRAVTYDSDGSNKTVIVVPKDAYFDEASNGQNRNDVAKTVTIMDKSLILLDTWFKGLDNVDDMALERAFIRQKGQEQLHKLQFMSFFEEDVHHFEADIDEQRKDAMAKIGLEINRSHPSPDCHQEKEK